MIRIELLGLVILSVVLLSAIGTVTSSNKGSIVVAGNFSIGGRMLNLAQYDLTTGEWSPTSQSELFLYGENNGVIWDIAINRTSNPYDSMYIVGAFDTDTPTSQLQLCSVSCYDGSAFSKVGEGICPKGDDSSPAMRIYTSVLGNNGDLYIGGTFESRVWNGERFANVFHAARYDARTLTWLPLVDGELTCIDGSTTRVNALAWDAELSILYLGGSFHAIDNVTISSGLAMWTRRTGLIDFPGGGVQHSDGGVGNTQVKAIAYETKSESLFISGQFHQINGKPCNGVAVWTRWSNLWRCLADDNHAISVVTSMLLTPTHLYLSGWAAATSSWHVFSAENPYAIARIDISGYIQENDARTSYMASPPPHSRHRSLTFSISTHNITPGQVSTGGASGTAQRRGELGNISVHSYIVTNQESNNRNNIHSGVKDSSRPNRNVISQILQRNHRWPEDRPCRTEAGGNACGWRNATVVHVHSRQQIKKSRYRRLRSRVASVLGSNHSSYSDHSDSDSDSDAYDSSVLGMNGSRRLDLLDWGVMKTSKHHHRRKHFHSNPYSGLNEGTDTSSGSSDSSGGNGGSGTTSTPAESPTARPDWVVEWKWLEDFKGANGPIFRLSEGRDHLKDTILIAGAFSNYPSIVVWSTGEGSSDPALTVISSIPGSYQLAGLITSVVQAYLPVKQLPGPRPTDNPIPSPPPSIRTDYAFLAMVGAAGMGIVIGLVFAIGCCTKQGFEFVYIPANFSASDTPVEASAGTGMPLITLSGNSTAALADFRICFERAMSARHLPTHESLIIINPQEIMLSRIIGEGSFGRVWNGHWRNNAVAVKEFVFAQAAIEGGSLQHNSIIEEIVGEAGVMACLRHPRILQLYGCSLTMQAIWIVSELCVKGSLRMVLSNKNVVISLQTQLTLCMDIADGMQYLHSRIPPIIHRDLKSLNIFITGNLQGGLVAKIGDWGSARAVALSGQKSMTQGVGTACWLSPEVISNAHFSKSSDVYAFGIILWEVFSRQEVYTGLSAAQIISKVAHEGLRPQIPRDCLCAELMAACWRTDPTQRPSFQVIWNELKRMYATTITPSQESDALLGPTSAYNILQSNNLSGDKMNALNPVVGDLASAQMTPDQQKELGHGAGAGRLSADKGGGTGGGYGSIPVPKGVLKVRSDSYHQQQPHQDNQNNHYQNNQQQQLNISTSPPSSQPTPRNNPHSFTAGLPSPTATATAAATAAATTVSNSTAHTPRTTTGTAAAAAAATSPVLGGVSPAGAGNNIYRNELPLKFDVSDLSGPMYYIMDKHLDDDADPLDFLFADHRRTKGGTVAHTTTNIGNMDNISSTVTNGSAAVSGQLPFRISPPHEVYVGDKALKPYTARRRSGTGSGSKNNSNSSQGKS